MHVMPDTDSNTSFSKEETENFNSISGTNIRKRISSCDNPGLAKVFRVWETSPLNLRRNMKYILDFDFLIRHSVKKDMGTVLIARTAATKWDAAIMNVIL